MVKTLTPASAGVFIDKDFKETEMATVTINGKEYDSEKLSDQAKSQLTNLRVCDAELQRLKAQVAITETARIAYIRALEGELPKTEN